MGQPLPATLDPALALGPVALSVAELERSLRFYVDHLGLTLLSRAGACAALGAGTTPLVELHELPGARILRRATGLYHFALRLPTRRDLARVIRQLAASGTRVDGAADHLVSEALYLSDPDGHGVEVYRDRPRATWFDHAGRLRGASNPLDWDGILAELAADEPAWSGLPPTTAMGHLHLQVADLATTERFYLAVLGFTRTLRLPTASFVSAGGYHHHVGMNTWAGAGVPTPPACAARLLSYTLWLPTLDALDAVLERVRAAGVPLTEADHGWSVADPAHIAVRLAVHPCPPAHEV